MRDVRKIAKSKVSATPMIKASHREEVSNEEIRLASPLFLSSNSIQGRLYHHEDMVS